MLISTFIPSLCVLALTWAIPTSSADDSNAERFAQGLGPRKPERLFNPTRTTNVLKPRNSELVTTASAIATVSFYNAPVPRDETTLEKRDTMYLSMNPNNGRVEVTTTSPYTYLFNNPSVERDVIQGVVAPGSLAYIGAARYPSQTDSTSYGHLKFGMYNGNVNAVGSYDTYIWNYPTANAEAHLIWTATNGTIIPLNFYVDTGDSNRLCAAKTAGEVREGLTEAARVTITFVGE